MPKGFFTQCAVVLLRAAPSRAALEEALQSFPLAGARPKPDPDWMGGPVTLLIPWDPETHGFILVDSLDAEWPDSMGHPEGDPELFGAWSLGFLGPFTWPGALERAVQQSWDGEAASELVSQHRAFLRIRSSFSVGTGIPPQGGLSGNEAPARPEGYDPVAELGQMTQVARALLALPGALAYFNPGGETIHTAASLDYHASRSLPPLDLWSNLRLFQVHGGWSLMDTVGMGQLEVQDHEACFSQAEPGQVASFLRGATSHALDHGPVIGHLDTMDGPGGTVWRAHLCPDSLIVPPRRTLRWFSLQEPEPLPGLLPS